MRWTLGFAASAWVLVFLLSSSFSSHAVIAIQQQSASAGVGALASQFGFALPVDGSGPTPALVVELARSSDVHAAVLKSLVEQAGVSDSLRSVIARSLQLEPGDLNVDSEEVRHAIGELITATAVQRSGVVRLSTRAKSRVVAVAMNRALVSKVDSFLVFSKRTRASEEVAFLESRREYLQAELSAAEQALSSFQRTNRVSGSPELALQLARLEQQVALRSQVLLTVLQSLERSRLEEARGASALNIIQQPTTPSRPDSRPIFALMLAGAFVGLLVGFARALSKFGTPYYEALEEGVDEHISAALSDIRRPWRLFVWRSER